MVSIYLRDGFHHIKVNEAFRDYLGFKCQIDRVEKYCRYTVCPFGLCDVPWLFTKILSPLKKHWRSNRLAVAIYLDDTFRISNTYKEAKDAGVHKT
jgi:hypothetical protein